MMLRSQLCQLSSSLYSNGSSTQQVLCTPTVRPQGTQRHATSSFAAAPCAVQVSHSQLGRWAAGASSSNGSSSLARSAGVICRDAPRPMWAAKTPGEDVPKAAGGDIARMITKDSTKCDSLVALSDVYNEWGGTFNYIHAAAAITKYAKLRRGRGTDAQLLPRLLRCWLQQLPDARERECANVLWALGKLGTGLGEVWEPTFEALLRRVKQDAQSVSPQNISNTLLACARLRKQPAPDQLQVLMQAVLLPGILAALEEQHLANTVWALGKLCQLEGWQGGVSEEAIQHLLGPQQLQLLSVTGTEQAISNLLMGLADMAMAEPPLISKAFASQCSRQVLADSCQRLGAGNVQVVCNTLHACGELGLADAPFLTAAAASAARWIPSTLDMAIIQAAPACAKLKFRNQNFMAKLLQRGQQMLQPTSAQGRQQRTLHLRALGQVNRERLVGRLCSAVTQLNVQQLAPQALQLVASSSIGRTAKTHPSNLRRLWVFHSWLLQHQLAGGQGLTGLLTQQQLEQGQQEATQYPDYV